MPVVTLHSNKKISYPKHLIAVMELVYDEKKAVAVVSEDTNIDNAE